MSGMRKFGTTLTLETSMSEAGALQEVHRVVRRRRGCRSGISSPVVESEAGPVAAEPPQKNRVTLETVAEAAGVSRATVSNAFNRPDQLSVATRRRILKQAKTLGYAGPDPAGRALSLGRFGALGVMFAEAVPYAFEDPAAIMILRGLASSCEDAGLGLSLLPYPPGSGMEQAALNSAGVDGLVIHSMPTGHPLVQGALGRRLPTVMIDSPRVEGSFFVGIDDRMAARRAADLVLDLGHRDIGIVSLRLRGDGRSGPVDEARLAAADDHLTGQRVLGYLDAMHDRGLGFTDLSIWETTGGRRSDGYQAASALLARGSCTAIIAVSDELAFGVLEAASEWGIRVPDDLSVVGFDDVPGASQGAVQLTTVRQPLLEKGRLAGRMLTDSISFSTEPTHRIFDTELIVRSTTGPAVQ